MPEKCLHGNISQRNLAQKNYKLFVIKQYAHFKMAYNHLHKRDQNLNRDPLAMSLYLNFDESLYSESQYLYKVYLK